MVLIDNVVHWLGEDPNTLCSCSLVSRYCAATTRYLRMHSIYLDSVDKLRRFCEFIGMQCTYRPLVKRVTLCMDHTNSGLALVYTAPAMLQSHLAASLEELFITSISHDVLQSPPICITSNLLNTLHAYKAVHTLNFDSVVFHNCNDLEDLLSSMASVRNLVCNNVNFLESIGENALRAGPPLAKQREGISTIQVMLRKILAMVSILIVRYPELQICNLPKGVLDAILRAAKVGSVEQISVEVKPSQQARLITHKTGWWNQRPNVKCIV